MPRHQGAPSNEEADYLAKKMAETSLMNKESFCGLSKSHIHGSHVGVLQSIQIQARASDLVTWTDTKVVIYRFSVVTYSLWNNVLLH